MSKSDESSKPQILYEFVESGSMHDLLNSHWGMSPYTFAYSQNAIIHINKLMQITINPIEGEFSKDQYDGAYSIWCFGKEADLPEGGYDLSSVERTFDVELSDLPDGSHEVTATLKSGPEIPPESNAVFSGVFPADWDLTENPDDNLRFLTYIYQNTDLPGHELVAEHIDWELADKNFSRGN